MKKVVLDTNFILYCVQKKIDFFSELPLFGFGIIIPEEVINEIKKFSLSKSERLRKVSNTSLKIIEKNKVEKLSLNSKIVDNGLINLMKENPEFVLATLDKELKNKIKNQKLVIRGNNRLEIV